MSVVQADFLPVLNSYFAGFNPPYMKKLTTLFATLFVSAIAYGQWTGTTDIYKTSAGNVGIGTGSTPLAKLHIVGTSGNLYNSFVAGDMNSTSASYLGVASTYIGFNMINTAANQWSFRSNGTRNGGAGIFSTQLGELCFVASSTAAPENATLIRTDSDINQRVYFRLAPWSAILRTKFNRGDDYRSITISAASDNNRVALGNANGYIGFNVEDSGDVWLLRGDGARNGGAAIVSNGFGEVKFYTVPTASTTTRTIDNNQFKSGEALTINTTLISTNRPLRLALQQFLQTIN